MYCVAFSQLLLSLYHYRYDICCITHVESCEFHDRLRSITVLSHPPYPKACDRELARYCPKSVQGKLDKLFVDFRTVHNPLSLHNSSHGDNRSWIIVVMLALRWIIPRHLIKHRLAAFSTNSRCHRDLIAKYRYRPPARVEEAEEYLTASTVPVTSSIQAVPSSAELSTSTWEKVNDVPFTGRKATPLPAMEPLHHEQSKEVKPQAEEIHVAGVIVPPKPSPPESDGEFSISLRKCSSR